MEKQSAITKMGRSRRKLLRAIQDLDEETMSTLAVEGVWTVKDLIAHINSWEAIFLSALRSFVNGDPWEPEIIYDYLSWNNQKSLEWQEKPVHVIRAEFESTRQEILSLVAILDEGQCGQPLATPWGTRETIPKMLSGLAWHETEHADVIQRYFK